MASQARYSMPLWEATALAASGTLVTGVIDCRRGDPEGLLLKVTGTGTPDVKLEAAFSNDGVTFNAYTAQDPIVASTNTEYATLQPQDFHLIGIPWAPFLKLKLTELTGSVADTVVTGELWLTELR